MALSDQIKEASEKLSALRLILSGVCDKIAEITECYDLLGTEKFQEVLDWQSNINQEIVDLQATLQGYYQQVEAVRNIMTPDRMPEVEPDMEPDDDEDDASVKEQADKSEVPDDYLLVIDRTRPSTWLFQTMVHGKPDHAMMKSAWDDLHGKYDGPDREAALRKLVALYKAEKVDLPSEADWAMEETIEEAKKKTTEEPTSKDLQDLIDQLSNDPTKVRKLMDIVKKMAKSELEAQEEAASKNPGDYLVVEDKSKPTTWHLQVKVNGKPSHSHMGAAWAALHGGYRGNKYEGPKKAAAISKLKALYKSEGMPTPKE